MYNEFKQFYGALKDDKDYEELRKYFNSSFPMFKNLILCDGQKNIVQEGPNIITANYTGTGRDVIGLLREYDRQLHFVATKYLFNKEASIKKAKEKLGPRKYRLLESMVERGSALLSERMTSLEMIPVDLDYHGDNRSKVVAQREVMDTIKDHLRKDEVIVLFQMQRNYMNEQSSIKEKSPHHDYLYKFSNTVSKIVMDLNKEGISVPVTPVAFYSNSWINPFRKTIMRIGKPQFISVYMDEKHPIPAFTDVLEQNIAEMLIGAGIPKNKGR